MNIAVPIECQLKGRVKKSLAAASLCVSAVIFHTSKFIVVAHQK
jgi:hypothetical protein